MITVKDIVQAYLEAKGLDGLANPGLGCGCGVNDLAPCGEISINCQAGRLHTVTKADMESGRYNELEVWPGCWVIEPVQGLSREGNVKPKMFHGEDSQGTES